MAQHIADGYEAKGVGHDKAEERAWRTVNKETGGAKKPGGAGRRPGRRLTRKTA